MSAGRDTEDRNARFVSTDSAGTADEDVQSVSSAGISAGGLSRDEHRDMLLASLLEDHYRTLAAELINTASPGSNYTRSSPEVQVLGQHLYREASQKLSSGRLLPAAATARVRMALAEDRGIRETARLTGVSPTKVLGIKREIDAEQGTTPIA